MLDREDAGEMLPQPRQLIIVPGRDRMEAGDLREIVLPEMGLDIVRIELEVGIGFRVVEVHGRQAVLSGAEPRACDQQVQQPGEMIGVSVGQEDRVDLCQSPTEKEIDSLAGIENRADLWKMEPG